MPYLFHNDLRSPDVRFVLLTVFIRQHDSLEYDRARSGRFSLEYDGTKVPCPLDAAHVTDPGDIDVHGPRLEIVREEERCLLIVLIEDRQAL